ncbi:MAG: aspartyl protease family protein [Alphaproteobacteria bacterium]|nr:aspartyl protease family protein [Alphaproteobacteria bacterium]
MPGQPSEERTTAHGPLLRGVLAVLLASGPGVAWGAPRDRAPDRVALPLYRPWREAPKVYVEVTLPDGARGLFLVDTGADLSVLAPEVAARLGLDLAPDAALVRGLDDETTVDLGRLPWLQLGGLTVRDVDVVVGVAGLSGRHGAMPVDGMLGTNVWSRFALDLDLRADRLTLWRPGTRRPPARATELRFDGRHAHVPVQLEPAEAPGTHAAVVLVIDTGATGILLRGPLDPALADLGSEGLERVHGIARGAAAGAEALRSTRRIPLASVVVGGRRLRGAQEVRWLGDRRGLHTGDGLIGDSVLRGRRLWLDIPGRALALLPTRRPARFHDGRRRWLELDLETHGTDPARAAARARVLAALDRSAEAEQALRTRLSERPDDAEAWLALGDLLRAQGALDAADEALLAVGPAELLARGHLGGAVAALLAAGRTTDVVGLLDALPADLPAVAAARADLALARGRPDEATASLALAPQGVDSMLRTVLHALDLDDDDGALALARAATLADPTDGLALRVYAALASPADLPTLDADLARVLERSHPSLRPLDALAAAAARLGDTSRAAAWRAEGVARDCAGHDADADNCRAWYAACAGIDLDTALADVRRALARGGTTASRLDTLAAVHVARGEAQEALAPAQEAVRRAPGHAAIRWTWAWIARRLGATPAAEVR